MWWILRLKWLKYTKKGMEQHSQDVASKVINNKNSDSFASHFAKIFTQKPSPQQCRKSISFKILSMVNSIGLIKTWGKLSCTLCTKEII